MTDDAPTIRRLGPDDFDAFHALMTRFYQHANNELPDAGEIRTLFDQAVSPADNIEFLVAVVKDECVGLVSATFGLSSYKVSPFAWCDDLYVAENHRNTGVGSLLLQAVEDTARRRGCSNILLAAGEGEDDTLEFYATRGFNDMKCRLLTLPL